MLVYGDHCEQSDPRVRLRQIAADLAAPRLTHEQLRDAFIALAGVTQGVADADFRRCGVDRRRSDEALLLEQLQQLAIRLMRSWDAGQCGGAGMPLQVPDHLPTEVEIRVPEGYAFYALYPERYALAARKLQLSGPPRIIGLRSIGAGLACMAAAALDAATPLSLRPSGDPFARELRIAPDLEQDFRDQEAHYVIVDEGPGLSGSSFGAVADWLEDHGISPQRIAFLPGHGNGPGPEASPRHRHRWLDAQRPVVAVDGPAEQWLEPVVGRLHEPLRDLSAGAWRTLWSASEADWPAIDPMWERRKFMARTETGEWLVKFAGLGSIGSQKLVLAKRLASAGFGHDVAALSHGWLVTRWHPDAAPARPTLEELTRYLQVRQTLAAPAPGASPGELLTMVRRNVPALQDWSPDLASLAPRAVCTDNRMCAHEWLRLPCGRLIKADALDHHAAHDLIGCQDIAWDIAGATVELGLDEADTQALVAATGADPELLAFYLVAYLAFRIGAHRLSAASLGHWPAEQARHLHVAERLERELATIDAVEHAGHIG